MHDDLKSFKQKPIPKISQNSKNFEEPQSLSKISKVRLEIMKCMIRIERVRSYQRKEVILRPSREWGSDLEREKGVWEGEKSERIERDRGEMA